jgi:hypothetical protein
VILVLVNLYLLRRLIGSMRKVIIVHIMDVDVGRPETTIFRISNLEIGVHIAILLLVLHVQVILIFHLFGHLVHVMVRVSVSTVANDEIIRVGHLVSLELHRPELAIAVAMVQVVGKTRISGLT